MDWQQIAALLIVGATVLFFISAKWRKSTKFNLAKDAPCGCGSSSASRPNQTLVFSARKGERPRIIVKNQARGSLR